MPHTVKLKAWAVDLGNYQTKFPLGRDATGKLLCDSFPSYAPVYDDTLASATLGAGMVVTHDVRRFVGSAVHTVMKGLEARQYNEDFCRSPEYYSLFLGAAAHAARYQEVDAQLEVEQLVVGLPVQASRESFAFVRRLFCGDHQLPHPTDSKRSLRLAIRDVIVVAQPQGAIAASNVHALMAGGKKLIVLVLDLGGGTFDWFTTEGYQTHVARCGSAPLGMNACAQAVAASIDPRLKDKSRILQRIDEALRQGETSAQILGKAEDLQPHLPQVEALLWRALQQMQQSVGTFFDVDMVKLTGGGAKVLRPILEKRLPELAHLVTLDADPHTENVRGFLVIAEQMQKRAENLRKSAA